MNRLVISFANEEALHRIRKLLESEGFSPAACCYAGSETARAVHKLGSAVVVCGFKLRDMTVNDLAADLEGAASFLVVSSANNLTFCDFSPHVFRVTTPCTRADFFEGFEQAARYEERNLHHPPPKRKEEDQALIQKAKALLMDVKHLPEAEAHRYMQKYSMDAGLKLTETARRILESYSSL